MKRLKLTLLMIGISFMVNAQSGYGVLNQQENNEKAKSTVSGHLSVASNNLFRGVRVDSSPSLQGLVSYSVNEALELSTKLEASASSTINTRMQVYGSAKINDKLKLVIDDYFFFGSGFNDYLYQYGKTIGSGHYDEARLEFENSHVKAMAAYVFYSTKDTYVPIKVPYLIENKGVYLESRLSLGQGAGFTVGYLTAQNAMMMINKGGFNVVGIDYTWKLGDNINLKAEVVANPNYRHNTNGTNNTPVTSSVSITM